MALVDLEIGVSDMATIYRLRERYDTLRTLGVATAYHPRYVNRTRDMHGLDVVLLSFVLDGRGRHEIDDQAFEERGGSVGITHYGQRHTLLTGAEGMEVMNVFLDPERHALPPLPAELRAVLPEFLPLHPAFQNELNQRVRMVFDRPERVRETLFRLHAELEERREGWAEMARAHLGVLLAECCRQFQRSGVVLEPRKEGASAALERVRRYLDEHYGEEHDLASLAKRARLNRSYLCRAFRAYTGQTLFAYLTRRRLQAAMAALRDGDEKVLRVAFECGFRDLTSFNRRFRAVVGTSPRAYRQRARQSAHAGATVGVGREGAAGGS